MKFLKFILSILIFISPANANTIFYLIKIPNLEIHYSKSSNGLIAFKYFMPFADLSLCISKFGILIRYNIVLALAGEINIRIDRIIFKNFISEY